MSSDLKPKDIRLGVPDWSTLHRPTGKLFTPIKDSKDWKQFRLTEEQVDQYWRDGYLINIPFLTPQECDLVLNDYRYFIGEAEHPGMDMMYEHHSNQIGDVNNVLMHALGQWRLTELFHELIFHPKAVVPASQLVQEDKEVPVRLWIDQMFSKPAHHGGCVAWHQDYSYWTRTRPMMHVTIHIALDEQTKENGAIHFIPGSHRWSRNGEPLPVTDYNFGDMDSIQRVLTEEEKNDFHPVCGNLKKGEISFHHPLTVHGSFPNRSDRPRRAAVLNYFADGVYSDTDEETLKGVLVPKGEKMAGQFFPLVYDPTWTKLQSSTYS